jgi:hypothetical protein
MGLSAPEQGSLAAQRRKVASYRAIYAQKPYDSIYHLTPELCALFYDANFLVDTAMGQAIGPVRNAIARTCSPLLIGALGLAGVMLQTGPLATVLDMACTQGIGMAISLAPRISHDRAEKREKGHQAMQRAFYAIMDGDDDRAVEAFRAAKQHMDGLDRSLFSKAFQVEFARGYKEFCDHHTGLPEEEFSRARFAQKVDQFVHEHEGKPGTHGHGLQKFNPFSNDPAGTLLDLGVIVTNPLRFIRNNFVGPKEQQPLTGWFVDHARERVSPIKKGLDKDDLSWMHEVMASETQGVHAMRAVLPADHGHTYYARKAERRDRTIDDPKYMNHNFFYRAGRHLYHVAYDIFNGPKNLWLDAAGRMTQAGRDARRDEAHIKIHNFVAAFASTADNPYLDVYGHLSDEGIKLLQQAKQVYNRVTNKDGYQRQSEDFRQVMHEALASVPLTEHQKGTLLSAVALSAAELQHGQLTKCRKGLSDRDMEFFQAQSYPQRAVSTRYHNVSAEEAHVGQAMADLEASTDLPKTLARKQQQTEGSRENKSYIVAREMVESQLNHSVALQTRYAELSKKVQAEYIVDSPAQLHEQVVTALIPPIMRQLNSKYIEGYLEQQRAKDAGVSTMYFPSRTLPSCEHIKSTVLSVGKGKRTL